MPQLHCYVPDDLAAELRRRADARGQTISGFLGELVRREVGTGWPPGFFETVVGAWRGEPLVRSPQPPLERRPEL